MYPKDLVGKKAMRTQPIDFVYYKDASFTKEPVFIIEANDNSMLYSWVNNSNGNKIKLDSKWINDNWIEYTE